MRIQRFRNIWKVEWRGREYISDSLVQALQMALNDLDQEVPCEPAR